jgi:hypothetical protein
MSGAFDYLAPVTKRVLLAVVQTVKGSLHTARIILGI